jgi:glycosyltransferase involved in cell wall biosynthesis
MSHREPVTKSTRHFWPFAARGSRENGSRSESPRILHLVLSLFRGGAEEHVLSLLAGVRSYGFTPLLAAPAPLLDTMATELAESRVKTLTITSPSSPLSISFWVQLAALLRTEHVDLIHCHSTFDSLCALPASRIWERRPIIQTCHGREFWREGKPIKGNFWLDRQASRLIDRFIAVSQATAQYLHESKGIPRNKIAVIPNGRDLKSLRPPDSEERARARAELGLKDEQMVLLLGRLAIEKGHSLLLDALKILGPRRPPLVAVFAGIGPLEAELKAKCKAVGLSDQVRFLGYRTDLARLMAAADLVVLPSISEGLPLAVVEALATARPVVATNTGGTPEIVHDGQTGLLIRPSDSAALAAAMDRVLSDPALALQLGTNGRLFVEQHFDVRVQIERTMALYSELIPRPTLSREASLRNGPSGRLDDDRRLPTSIQESAAPTGSSQVLRTKA